MGRISAAEFMLAKHGMLEGGERVAGGGWIAEKCFRPRRMYWIMAFR